jgi:hypothetical protein
LLDTRTVDDIARGFAAAQGRGIGAMIVPATGVMRNNRELIVAGGAAAAWPLGTAALYSS